MALSTKQKKELTKLRSEASDIWDDQKELLEQAAKVVREASHHAADVGRTEVAPRLQDAADTAKDKLTNDVLPAVGSAMTSALALLEVAKDPRVREAIKRVGSAGTGTATKVGAKAGIVKAPKSSGPGKYILIALGIVAVAGVAYAAWQTLRADDELWVSDDADDSSADSVETTGTPED
jgi:hypothetical protein